MGNIFQKKPKTTNMVNPFIGIDEDFGDPVETSSDSDEPYENVDNAETDKTIISGEVKYVSPNIVDVESDEDIAEVGYLNLPDSRESKIAKVNSANFCKNDQDRIVLCYIRNLWDRLITNNKHLKKHKLDFDNLGEKDKKTLEIFDESFKVLSKNFYDIDKEIKQLYESTTNIDELYQLIVELKERSNENRYFLDLILAKHLFSFDRV